MVLCWKIFELILLKNSFGRSIFPNIKSKALFRYFFSSSIPIILIIRRKLYAVNINPTSALARLIPFFVKIDGIVQRDREKVGLSPVLSCDIFHTWRYKIAAFIGVDRCLSYKQNVVRFLDSLTMTLWIVAEHGVFHYHFTPNLKWATNLDLPTIPAIIYERVL